MEASSKSNESIDFIDKLSNAAGIFSGWLMLLVSFCICYEIVSRFVFGKPTIWVYDVTTYALVWYSFIAAGYALKEGRHLHVDIFTERCSLKVKIVLEIVGHICVLILACVILFYSVETTIDVFISGEAEPTLISTPLWTIYAGMVLGAAVLSLQAIQELRKSMRLWFTTQPSDSTYSFVFRSQWFCVLILFTLVGIGVFMIGIERPALGIFILVITMLTFGIPVFASLGLAGVIGILFIFGMNGLPQVSQICQKATESNVLLAIPLYVMAGQLLQSGRIGPELFAFASAWGGHIRGGYAIATVVACGIFAAVSGSSVATAAAIGSIAIPEMLKRGYKPSLAYGIVAGGGTLGVLIPPSGCMIIYSSMTNVSTGALFMGGVLPGLVLVGAFAIYAFFAADKGITQEKSAWKERLAATRYAIWGLLAPLIVLGGIYSGAFTPTEAAAVTVLYGLIVALSRGTIRPREIQTVISDGTLSSTMIMMIIVGA
ncbi:MAG: TRAP transporter large permease subunit, partial [Desulforhabdus sp.]|nr:TRAP transporter large permease subunit [Desulforhabdus sp.]